MVVVNSVLLCFDFLKGFSSEAYLQPFVAILYRPGVFGKVW